MTYSRVFVPLTILAGLIAAYLAGMSFGSPLLGSAVGGASSFSGCIISLVPTAE